MKSVQCRGSKKWKGNVLPVLQLHEMWTHMSQWKHIPCRQELLSFRNFRVHSLNHTSLGYPLPERWEPHRKVQIKRRHCNCNLPSCYLRCSSSKSPKQSELQQNATQTQYISKISQFLHQFCLPNHMSGGQNYSLPAMDMAKVGGPLSVVKVCTSTLCAKIGYR